ncbi:hypothetical protein ACW9UR_19135 [Halovulum sp. GXIMD14794]
MKSWLGAKVQTQERIHDIPCADRTSSMGPVTAR